MENQIFNPSISEKMNQYCANQLSILGYDVKKISLVDYEMFDDYINLFIQDKNEFRKPIDKCTKVQIKMQSFFSFCLKDFSTEILQQELKNRGLNANHF